METTEPKTACSKSELDFWKDHSVQTCITESYYSYINPIGNVDSDSPLEFVFNVPETDYLAADSIFLKLVGKIVDTSTNDVPAEKKCVYLVNNITGTLFKDIEVLLNSTNVATGTNNLYAYRSMLELMLTNTHAWRKSVAGMLIHDDKQNDQPFVDLDTITIAATNPGLTFRYNMTKRKTFEALGRISADVFQQPKLIPSLAKLKIKLTKNEPSFYIMSKNENKSYTLKLESAKLICRFVRVSPQTQEVINQVHTQFPMRYPLTRNRLSYFTKPQGLQDISIPNLVNGKLPRRVYMCIVKSDAFHGSKELNPMAFQHFNVSNLALSLNNCNVPFSTLSMDFENDRYAEAYLSLMQASGSMLNGQECGISHYRYKHNHNVIYGFDLSKDEQGDDDSYKSPERTGVISLDIKLSQATQAPITIITMMQFDDTLLYYKNKDIKFESNE